VDVAVDAARREDVPLAGHYFGGHAHYQARVHAGHDVRIACLANAHDAPALDADIGLVHAGVVEYQRISNQQVERVGLPDAGRLPHAIAQGFAPTKLAFLAVHAVVALDL
jgi:hypothetical protein